VRSPAGIGDLQSPLLFFPSFARHSFGPANKFADLRKDPSRSIKMRIAGFGWRVGLAGYQAVEFLAIEDQLKINKKVKPAPWF